MSDSIRFANVIFLINQAIVARSKVDDATIGEAVLFDVVMRDNVVLVSASTDLCITREAEIHDALGNEWCKELLQVSIYLSNHNKK